MIVIWGVYDVHVVYFGFREPCEMKDPRHRLDLTIIYRCLWRIYGHALLKLDRHSLLADGSLVVASLCVWEGFLVLSPHQPSDALNQELPMLLPRLFVIFYSTSFSISKEVKTQNHLTPSLVGPLLVGFLGSLIFLVCRIIDPWHALSIIVYKGNQILPPQI